MPFRRRVNPRADHEAQSARRLQRLVRTRDTWDGEELLAELVARHSKPRLSGARLAAVGRLISVIMWGELAAWKVSEKLAESLESPLARTAAANQAQDEARHFAALHDYLQLLGWPANQPPRAVRQTLDAVLGTRDLAKQLVGMQLMVEPVALTFFQLLQEARLDPVLSGLLARMERDEARHIALGINHLPVVVDRMSPAERGELWAWQVRMFMREMSGLKELEEDLRTLGFDPRQTIRLGRSKQLYVMDLVSRQLRFELPLVEFFNRAVEFRQELDYGSRAPGGLLRAMRCALNPEELALSV